MNLHITRMAVFCRYFGTVLDDVVIPERLQRETRDINRCKCTCKVTSRLDDCTTHSIAYRMPKFAIYVQNDTSDKISPDWAGAQQVGSSMPTKMLGNI